MRRLLRITLGNYIAGALMMPYGKFHSAAETLGYASFFTLTFFLALPAYALLPWVRGWISDKPD